MNETKICFGIMFKWHFLKLEKYKLIFEISRRKNLFKLSESLNCDSGTLVGRISKKFPPENFKETVKFQKPTKLMEFLLKKFQNYISLSGNSNFSL